MISDKLDCTRSYSPKHRHVQWFLKQRLNSFLFQGSWYRNAHIAFWNHHVSASSQKTTGPTSSPYNLPFLGFANASCSPGSRYHLSAVDLFPKTIQPKGLPWPTCLGPSSFHPQLSWNCSHSSHQIDLSMVRSFPVQRWQSNMASWKSPIALVHFPVQLDWLFRELPARQ